MLIAIVSIRWQIRDMAERAIRNVVCEEGIESVSDTLIRENTELLICQ